MVQACVIDADLVNDAVLGPKPGIGITLRTVVSGAHMDVGNGPTIMSPQQRPICDDLLIMRTNL